MFRIATARPPFSPLSFSRTPLELIVVQLGTFGLLWMSRLLLHPNSPVRTGLSQDRRRQSPEEDFIAIVKEIVGNLFSSVRLGI